MSTTENAPGLHLARDGGDLIARMSLHHSDFAGYTAVSDAGGDGCQGLFRLLLHGSGVDVRDRAGIERDALAGRDCVDQSQSRSAGPCLGDGVGNQVIDIGQIGGHHNLVGHDERPMRQRASVEGFHDENLLREVCCRRFPRAVTAGTSGCDAYHPDKQGKGRSRNRRMQRSR